MMRELRENPCLAAFWLSYNSFACKVKFSTFFFQAASVLIIFQKTVITFEDLPQ